MQQFPLMTKLEIKYFMFVLNVILSFAAPFLLVWTVSVATGSVLNTLCPAYNEFTYNGPSSFLCVKIIDINVIKFGYNKQVPALNEQSFYSL